MATFTSAILSADRVLLTLRMRGLTDGQSTIVQMWCDRDEALLLARKIHDALEGREVPS